MIKNSIAPSIWPQKAVIQTCYGLNFSLWPSLYQFSHPRFTWGRQIFAQTISTADMKQNMIFISSTVVNESLTAEVLYHSLVNVITDLQAFGFTIGDVEDNAVAQQKAE